LVTASVALLSVWAGCRSRPDPDQLFADAESLRARYEKGASEQALAKYRAALAEWEQKGEMRRAAAAAQRIGLPHF